MLLPNRVSALALVGIAFFVALGASARVEEAAAEKAQEAADGWLELVDEGNYAASWDAAAEYFKARVTKDQWEKAARSVREPLGTLKSRKLLSAKYTRQLPGAPDGEYVVIQYESSFANKASAIETVTPLLDKDGRWRVSGYFIK